MENELMSLISIRDALSNSGSNPATFFCLPSDSSGWTLDTKGMFALDSIDFGPESDEFLPEQVREGSWVEALEGADIESIVYNVNYQIKNPTSEQLLRAFIYYYENDAFICF